MGLKKTHFSLRISKDPEWSKKKNFGCKEKFLEKFQDFKKILHLFLFKKKTILVAMRIGG